MPAPAHQTPDRIDEARWLLDTGKVTKARNLLKEVLQANPRHFDAAFTLAVTYAVQDNLKMAANAFSRAVEIDPTAVEGHYNLAYALQKLGENDAALASYDRALKLEPDYHQALHNRGVVLEDLNRLDESLESLDAALKARPDAPESLYNRGSVLMKLNRLDEALENLNRAIELDQNHVKAFSNRGLVHLAQQHRVDALDDFSRAVALDPSDAESHYNRGVAAGMLKRNDLALTSYREVNRLKPDDVRAWSNQGGVLDQMRRYEEAIVCFERVRKLAPQTPYLDGLILSSRLHLCDWKDYDALVSRVLDKTTRDQFGAQPHPSLLIPSTRHQQRQAAALWVAAHIGKVEPEPFAAVRKPGERIRVAYVSADFQLHPVALLTARMFELHDRSRFEIYAMSISDPSVDWMRKRMEKAVEHFINIRDFDDDKIVALMREHGIDIAIDMTGYTGNARVGVFARRSAPVQVNYLGYSATMGVDFIDYIIGDPVLIPPGHAPDYSEKIARLPDCYMPSDPTREIATREFKRADYGLPEQGFVFCAFNNQNKITPGQFDIWMRILKAVEGSVLWMSANHAKAIENLKREAVRRGVDPARLVFAKREDDIADHLGRHQLADLFLDTLPYNAHATCNDSLWAGLPVLTRLGEGYAARVAGSLVTNVGMADMIAKDDADYEARAIEIATTPGRAAELKARLAANLPSAPLFNVERYTRNIEAAYSAMHERRMAGQAPAHIDVAVDGSVTLDATAARD
ncbi:MAG: repeat-containing protein [Hyphomicrobiales bacterium]|nr:repeat-containing protein [Hyphomicrobiales bacterium]